MVSKDNGVMTNQLNRPNTFIIGAGKCGTTSLSDLFSRHPECCASQPKEVCFFQDTIHGKPNENYAKGWSWYQRAVAHWQGEPVVVDATPDYSNRVLSPNTASRIYDFNAKANIIYMVRNPLQRITSAWKMHLFPGDKPNREVRRKALHGFEPWMEIVRDEHLWSTSLYHFQLQAYQDVFPENQLMVVFLEDWRQDRDTELRRVAQFLKISYSEFDTEFQGSNRADQRRERTALGKLAAATGVTKVCKQFVPARWRSTLNERFASKVSAIENPSTNNAICREYLQYVSEDNEQFLAAHGKPRDFWTYPEAEFSRRVRNVA